MQGLSWINGTYTFKPMVSAFDRGLLLADGLFETIRVAHGKPCDFDAHYARLTRGLDAFQLRIHMTKVELLEVANQLITKVPLQGEIGRLRLTVTRGAPEKSTTVLMTLQPYERPAEPLELALSKIIRTAGNPSSTHKTLAYTDNFHAQREVALQGNNRVAVLCNQWGRVACASIGNVFVKVDNTWLTPAISEGALPGITRGKLLEAGIYDGLPVAEGSVTIEQFKRNEVLLTNVLRGVERGRAI